MVIVLISIIAIYLALQALWSAYYFNLAKELAKKTHTTSAEIGDKNKPKFKLLVVGDSVGAGVSASSFKNSLAGRVANFLVKDHFVSFQDNADTGARMQDVLVQKPAQKQDLILIVASSNDLFRFTNVDQFSKDVQKVVETYSLLTDKVIIEGPGRVFNSNAIPLFLKPIYKIRAKLYSDAIDRAIAGKKNIVHVNPHDATQETLNSYGNTFAPDKFHPNDEGHKFWFDLIAGKL